MTREQLWRKIRQWYISHGYADAADNIKEIRKDNRNPRQLYLRLYNFN